MLSWKSDVLGSCSEIRRKSRISGFEGYWFFQRRFLLLDPLQMLEQGFGPTSIAGIMNEVAKEKGKEGHFLEK